jgi:hypothetical protein
MGEQRDGKEDDLIPTASTKVMCVLNDPDVSSIKSASATNLELEWIAEAREDSFFAQLWDGDGLFKRYATAAVAVGCISGLSVAERAAFYRQIATKSRTEVLTYLSGIEVRPGTLQLLSKTDYELFEEDDWRVLLSACTDPVRRRELHTLDRISPILVHQIRQIPDPIFCRAILAVLNVLEVSTEHWGQLSRSFEEASASARSTFTRKARGVRSIGSLWNFFFECTECAVKPFVFPESFSGSPLLELLETSEQMRSEGLQMRNCVAQRVSRVVAGWDAYFHWKGAQPATVQLVRVKQAWRLGQIRAAGNVLMKPAAAAEIVEAVQQIIDSTADDRPIDREPFLSAVESVRIHGVELFDSAAIGRIAGELKYIKGTSHGLDHGSYCIVEGTHGFIQFMADSEGDEFLCEIQSHKFAPEVGGRLTDSAVSLVTGCGFQWPHGKHNFLRWFSVSTDDELHTLAGFALGILSLVFKQSPEADLRINTQIGEDD